MTHLSDESVIELASGEGRASDLEHEAACEACARRVRESRETLALLQRADVPEPSPVYWETLRSGGVSHVIVHEAAWLDDRGPRTTAALTELGATEIFREGSDVILRLP